MQDEAMAGTAEDLVAALPERPDTRVSVARTFGIASDLEVGAFARRTEYVPDIDATYQFDREIGRAHV